MRGFEGRITDRHPGDKSCGVHQGERGEIGEIGTRNSPSVSRPDIRASVNVVLNLNARQEIRVGLRPGRWCVPQKESISSDGFLLYRIKCSNRTYERRLRAL